ncbi:NASP-related protein sim3 [Madurella mycetomatis]|uniref:NASP-related protein sim3 n=1 Tax=Madurella mycetomatis TaxID=100816 RepID=A0A175WAD2_9PEZI|nr:NASP-related protein sim3 [Madurella mycetomatis]
MATPTPTTGTATPLELDPEQAALSLKVSLADLSAKATALYARKQYEDAAEVYAQAAEMQAEMNGEMNAENAEILFLYGRALFKVGQSKSDVLGGKAPDAKKQTKPKPVKQAKAANGGGAASAQKNDSGESVTLPAAAVAETETKLGETIGEAAAKEVLKKEKEAPGAQQKKPMFHFEGDENFVDSEEEDDEEDAEEGEGGEEEEEDDLAVAFEILDLARVLFNKRLESVQGEDDAQQGKGKEVAAEGDSATVKHIKERLADTHDLLAEISLENERYPNAITDSRASLKYKEELYPFESEIIAEAHFKLSLALEFASMTKSSDDKDTSASETIDQPLRDEAAAQLEAAINSTKLKLQNKEVELATLHNPDDNEATRRQIADVKEMLADMEQRLVELRKAPLDLNSALGIEPAPKPAPIVVPDEVKKKATDLTGLVRKKRKAEEGDDGKSEGDAAKKAREDDVNVS